MRGTGGWAYRLALERVRLDADSDACVRLVLPWPSLSCLADVFVLYPYQLETRVNAEGLCRDTGEYMNGVARIHLQWYGPCLIHNLTRPPQDLFPLPETTHCVLS
jgi:hypothetical protein